MEEHINIDGSIGEGGGQIVRSSLALSLLTGRSFRIRNIRAKRSKPGLQPQHLMSVRAAAQIGQAQVDGVHRGSTAFSFVPGTTVPGKYHFAIGTAGATALVLQTVYLPLAMANAPSQITIDGGTHVSHAPCYHFLESTWLGYVKLLGMEIDLQMKRPGFYPRGGGLMIAQIQPCRHLKGLMLDPFEDPDQATGFSAVAGLPEHIAQRQAQHATKRLETLGLRTNIREEKWQQGPGSVLAVKLDTKPVPTMFFSLGRRGLSAERVADLAIDEVEAFLAAESSGVDPHSGDQLLLPLAVAEGPSSYAVAEVTSHLLTNAFVVQQFLDRPIRIEGKEGRSGVVHVE